MLLLTIAMLFANLNPAEPSELKRPAANDNEIVMQEEFEDLDMEDLVLEDEAFVTDADEEAVDE